MKTNILTLLALLFSFITNAQTLPKASKGSFKFIENFSSKYVSPRSVAIWLPPKKKYAVLYMHDGQILFDSTTTWNKQEWSVDETISRLMAEKKIKDCIVVAIWNDGKNRHADYFPQKSFESLPILLQDSLILKAKRNKETALFSMNVQSDKYLKFLAKKLKLYIDKTYPTKPDAKNTFVMGSSGWFDFYVCLV